MRRIHLPVSTTLVCVLMCGLIGSAEAYDVELDSPTQKGFRPPATISSQAASFVQDTPFVVNRTGDFSIDRRLITADVAPSDPNTIYLAGEAGRVYFTRDGGQTWHRTAVRYPQVGFREVATSRRFLSARLPPFFLRWPWWPFDVWATNYLIEFLEPITQDVERLVDHGPRAPDMDLDLLEPGQTPGQDEGPQSFARSEKIESQWWRPYEAERRKGWRRWITQRMGFEKHLDSMGTAPVDYTTPNWIQPDAEYPSWIDIHRLRVNPTDPKDVIIATNDGLYRSYDGGWSWHREFSQPEFVRRDVRHVYWDDHDPKRRFLCTRHGVLVTYDDGNYYEKVKDNILRRIPCYWTAVKPGEPQQIWVGTVFGVWISENGGDTFRLAFFRNTDGRREIRKIRFHPDDPERALLVAREGIFVTDDGGDSFRMLGRNRFYKQMIEDAQFGPGRNHIVVVTRKDVWETFDGGQNWRIVLFGNTGWELMKLMVHRGKRTRRFLMSSTELLEFVPEPPADTMAPDKLESVKGEMPMWQTLKTALKHFEVYRGDLTKYRDTANVASYLPKLELGGGVRHMEPHLKFGHANIGQVAKPGGPFPRQLKSNGHLTSWFLTGYLYWQFDEVLFSQFELPKGEAFERNDEFARKLRKWVRVVYAERRRLQLRGLAGVEEGPVARAKRRVRIRELTEYLDMMTGGAFTDRINSTSKASRVGSVIGH